MTSSPLARAGAVAVVTPVYGNETTLAELVRRLAVALDGRNWRLRMVVDASPDASLVVARRLAAADPRIAVTALHVNAGQHRALSRGLVDEDDAAVWVCLDADLQDPPEAIPLLLDRLAAGDAGDVGVVFAGRRGTYESRGRTMTGRMHRAVMSRLSGLPPDAGAFVAMGPVARHAVISLGSPSIVAAIGASGVALASVPVGRHPRPSGLSAWSSAGRVRQSVRTLAWSATAGRRAAQVPPGGPVADGPATTASHRCTSVSE